MWLTVLMRNKAYRDTVTVTAAKNYYLSPIPVYGGISVIADPEYFGASESAVRD